MTHLEPIFDRFARRLDALEDIFGDWVKKAPPKPLDPDIMFLEGLVSSLWQHWSLFCRRVVFASAIGCTTRTGKVISGCVSPATWERVSYIAWRANSGGRVQPSQLNSDLKKEPTWGDVQKLQSVIAVLSPYNATHLVSCLGSVSRGPVHVQVVRNAASHRNFQTFDNVKNLRIYYNVKPIRHPVEAVIWAEPSSNDFAFKAWVDEMRIVADLITD